MRAVIQGRMLALFACLFAIAPASADARGPAPGLAVTAVRAAPAVVVPGGSITVRATLAKPSGRPARAARLALGLRAEGRVIALRRVHVRLRASRRVAVRIPFRIARMTPAGRYRVIVCTTGRRARCRGAAKVSKVATRPLTLTTAAGPTEPRPSFSGTAAPAPFVTVEIASGGRSAVTLIALPAPDGTWAARPVSALPDGAYSARATQTDIFGRTRTSPALGFRIDTTAPPVSLDEPADGSTTTDRSPTLSGASGSSGGDAPDVTVRLYSGATATGRPIATLTATASGGRWRAATAGTLADGVYTAQAEQSDAAGHVGRSAPTTFRVKANAPAVSLVNPVNGRFTADSTPTLDGAAGSAPGDGSTVTVTISSQSTTIEKLTTTRSGSSWSATPHPPLADGVYAARASQRDSGGNTGASALHSFTVDTHAPIVALTLDPATPNGQNNLYKTMPAVHATADDPNHETLDCEVDGSSTALTNQPAHSTHSAEGDVPVSGDGSHTIACTATDKAGNSASTPPETFTADTHAPVVAVTLSPSTPDGENSFYRSMPTAHATADDPNNEALDCEVDGTSTALTNQPAHSTHSAEGDVPVSGDGTHTVACTGTDHAGNATPSSNTFKVDSAAPTVTISSPAAEATTNDQTPTVSGTASSASGDSASIGVKVYSGTATSGSALQSFSPTRDGSGNWSTAAAATLPVGTYTAVATQTDSAGNAGTDTRTFKSPGVVLAAGDIASCAQTGDTQTASLLAASPADKVAALGDNAYEDGSATDFANCYGPTWGAFKANTAPAAGNHEYNTANAAGYFGYFGAAAGNAGEGWYSYDLGDWHVIVLNSSKGCSPVACGTGSPQRAFLQNDLDAHSNQCTLAYWHHPLFTSDSNAFAGATSQVKPFWDDLYAAGADVVLNGHSHIYERFAPQSPTGVPAADGIRQFIVGTGGYTEHTISAPVANSEALDNDTFGVLRLVLRPNDYSWQFLPVAGKTFTDAGSGTCH